MIKEKKIYAGNYLEIDVIPYSGRRKRKGVRKKWLSPPKQKNLNEKNSRRYFIQLVNANFKDGDYHLTLTYNDKTLPKSEEEIQKEIRNFLNRLRRKYKKAGAELKYILVTEAKNKNGQPTRVHHHLVINNALSRDEIEGVWKNGYANCDRLQSDEYGFEALARYLTKNANGKKRWSDSRNLIKPLLKEQILKDGGKYSRRKMERIAKNSEDGHIWEKMNNGYIFTKCEPIYNDITGWSLYVKMRKRE